MQLPFLAALKTKALPGLLALALAGFVPCAWADVGAWTPLTNPAPVDITTMLLLTDGTVMAQGPGDRTRKNGGALWYRLTPDAAGSYANGTWSPMASMINTRKDYASAVLANGKVLVAGGEYSSGGSDTNTAEIYDPLADVWTSIASPPGWTNIGDAPCKVLFDGRFLLGNISDQRTAIYDPATGAWTAGGTVLAPNSGEDSWTLLPDQSVVTVDCSGSLTAEKYIPAQGAWVGAGSTPVNLVQTSSAEIGPSLLLPTGRVFCIGATGRTALYTPPAVSTDPGTWQTGPSFPLDANGHLLEAKDAPGAVLPSGHVLCVAATAGQGSNYAAGQQFFEYDGTNLNPVSLPYDAATTSPSFSATFLLLPTGQVLYSNYDTQMFVYTPTGSPDPAWKPTISSVTPNTDGSYTLTGTQLNGLDEGAAYGDDVAVSTNYPLVRLTGSAGNVWYARTFNHSSMGVATGAAPVSTHFTLPASLPLGAYSLSVVANGIASDPVPFTTPAQHLLWNKTDGTASLWTIAGSGVVTYAAYGPFPGWTARAVADAPDGSVDLLWTNTNGTASLWNVTAGGYTSIPYGPFASYAAVSLSVGSDGNPRLLWDKTDGTALLWTINHTNGAFTYTTYGPFAGWTANQVASGTTVTDLLWTKTDGAAAGWRIAANGTYAAHTIGPFPGYHAVGLSVGPDNGAHLLWDSTSGTESLWSADFTTGAYTYTAYGPFSGYSARAIATGPDNVTHLLWDSASGLESLWAIPAGGSGYTHAEYGPFSGWTAVGVSAGP